MENKIFSDYGITLVERHGKIIALFDSGEIALQYLEVEISEGEAEKVKHSQQEAYEVIMSLGSRIKKSSEVKEKTQF